MKTFALLFTLTLVSLNALAVHSYYPKAFNESLSSLKDDQLKKELNNLLVANHQRNKDAEDTLGCDTTGVNGCYSQRSLGYDGARRILFGKMYLKNDGNGFYIEDVYCQKRFSGSAKVGPNAIPNQDKINCEHTWPQSKFSNLYPKDVQKADLHHLYPTDSKANGIRGNFNFAEVSYSNGKLDEINCDASKSGASTTSGSDDYFEPPTNHKGNVARSLFYFSVRYKISIPRNEEEVLRRWNEIDPVDQDELERNETVYQAQGNRNPFIDFPNLANSISRF